MRPVSLPFVALVYETVGAYCIRPGLHTPGAYAIRPYGWTLWLCGALLSLALMACSPAAAKPQPQVTAAPADPPAATQSFPITIVDSIGRTAAIAKRSQRIVSLSAANTEVLYALGLEDRVAGVDDYSNYPPSVGKKPRVGSFAKPDLEKVVVLEPDLILGTNIHVKSTLPELEQRGLTVIVVDPKNVKGVLEGIRLVGQATGQPGEADTLAESLRARIEQVENRVKGVQPVRVFFELSPELHAAGPGTFIDDMIRLAGGTNIAAGAGKEWPQLNQESVFLADPQVIFLSDHGSQGGQSPESVAARPGWRQISAVKDNRIVPINPDIINRAGPRVVEGLEFIARTLHPEQEAQGNGR